MQNSHLGLTTVTLMAERAPSS